MQISKSTELSGHTVVQILGAITSSDESYDKQMATERSRGSLIRRAKEHGANAIINHKVVSVRLGSGWETRHAVTQTGIAVKAVRAGAHQDHLKRSKT